MKVTGTLRPKGNYPVVEDINLKGSYQVVKTIDDRDSIPELNRKIGMVVYVEEEDKLYKLTKNGWEELIYFNEDSRVSVSDDDSKPDYLKNKIEAVKGVETKVNTDSEGYQTLEFIAKTDNKTIDLNDNNELEVKDGGINITKLADNIDATGKHFNADKVDGKDVDDNQITDKNLWTAKKIKDEIDSKTFISLPDTPESYQGNAGKFLKVKDDESGLEFTDVPTGNPVGDGGLFGGKDTYKVKMDSDDDNPDYLSKKIDNETIKVNDNKQLEVNIDDSQVTDKNLWSAKQTKLNSIISAIIFG